MRKSKVEAAATRDHIVATAADYLRRTGIERASLVDMMAAAGLTHGGFYKHFASKEQLVAEAFATAAAQDRRVVEAHLAAGGVLAVFDGYVSAAHRDTKAAVCPFVAYGGELSRAGEAPQAAAGDALESLFELLAVREDGAPCARGEAIAAFATMVGAVTLARAVSDESLSDEILRSAKAALHDRFRATGDRSSPSADPADATE